MRKILKKLKINKINLENRICISPMSQYSSDNGNPSAWHYEHLGQLSKSGAGLLMIESTAVSKKGRISLKDLTLFNKKNEKSLKKLVKFLKKKSEIKVGIQLSHAGRKGSAEIPWIKYNSPIKNNKKWKTLAPSPLSRDKHWPKPMMLNLRGIKQIINEFKRSAQRANRAGLDCLEVHMSHGYLLHQFFSPISNLREDHYGGSIKNRCRFLIEIASAIRSVWPKTKILGARVSGNDWLKKGATIKDCIYLVKKLKKIGFDYACVTSGGILPITNIKFKPGYQVFLAGQVRKKTNIITRTAGMIRDLQHAEKIFSSKKADLVSFGRKFINSPTWLIKEKLKYKMKADLPNQYKRCF